MGPVHRRGGQQGLEKRCDEGDQLRDVHNRRREDLIADDQGRTKQRHPGPASGDPPSERAANPVAGKNVQLQVRGKANAIRVDSHSVDGGVVQPSVEVAGNVPKDEWGNGADTIRVLLYEGAGAPEAEPTWPSEQESRPKSETWGDHVGEPNIRSLLPQVLEWVIPAELERICVSLPQP